MENHHKRRQCVHSRDLVFTVSQPVVENKPDNYFTSYNNDAGDDSEVWII